VPDEGFANAAAFAVWKEEMLERLEEELARREEQRVKNEAAAERARREWKYREAQKRENGDAQVFSRRRRSSGSKVGWEEKGAAGGTD
jgi:hypothetical protein